MPRTRLYVPKSMRVKIKRSGEFQRIDHLRGHRLFPEELAQTPDKFVLTFRPTMLAGLQRGNADSPHARRPPRWFRPLSR